MPQGSRYTLGGKIDALCIETLESLLVASHLPKADKIAFVRTANQKLDLLKFFLQVAWEIKALDTKKYGSLSESIQEIGRMIGGWIRQLETRP